MNPWLALLTFIILLLSFFSSDLSREDVLTGTAVGGSQDIFTKSFYFRAWKTTGIAHGSGSTGDDVVTIELPRVPQSCTLNTRWKTDNKIFASLGRPQLYCHGAEGTTSGAVDKSGQSVTSDSRLFRWAGETEPNFDPLPYRMDDYIFHLWGCDHLYYTSKGKRYYVRGKVENFGSTTFDLHWEYFNDNTLEAVDVFADLKCQLTPERRPVATTVRLPAPQVEEPKVTPEIFDVDVNELEAPAAVQPLSGWERFKRWLVGIFF